MKNIIKNRRYESLEGERKVKIIDECWLSGVGIVYGVNLMGETGLYVSDTLLTEWRLLVISPEQFVGKMVEHKKNPKVMYNNAVNEVCGFLAELGYKDGADIFKEIMDSGKPEDASLPQNGA